MYLKYIIKFKYKKVMNRRKNFVLSIIIKDIK